MCTEEANQVRAERAESNSAEVKIARQNTVRQGPEGVMKSVLFLTVLARSASRWCCSQVLCSLY